MNECVYSFNFETHSCNFCSNNIILHHLDYNSNEINQVVMAKCRSSFGVSENIWGVMTTPEVPLITSSSS